MTIELRPMGVACQMACDYCYQEPTRIAGNINTKYDVDKMLKVATQIRDENKRDHFSLFGGEALLTPKSDLEKFFKHFQNVEGSSSIQTNGALIDDDHIELFKKYNVNVGVSIDGSGELNSLRKLRKNESVEKTTKNTDIIIQNIRKLRENKINVGIIITLHKLNGSKENLPKLIEFIKMLGDIGVFQGNIHTLEVESTMLDADKIVLTEEENTSAFLELARFFDKEENSKLRYSPFLVYEKALKNDESSTMCYMRFCDPWTTRAVQGVEGDGAVSNCGRTNKEGIEWHKSNKESFTRYISTYYAPEEMDGCKGCRFWFTCAGECPGESIDGDFRNKSIHCNTMKQLFAYYEEKLVAQGIEPLSLSPKLPHLEHAILESFKAGKKISVSKALDFINNIKSNQFFVPVYDENGNLLK